MKYAYAMGIGGKGIVPGRPQDSFGVGWARTELSADFLRFLRQRVRLGLEREDAIELYYSAAITPWLSATADLQIVEPALARSQDASGRLEDAKTTIVAGLRLLVRF